ncbi:MAG: hypothetical protein HKN51_10050 [Saprospiraceae bacterium]|nr:hypothetical protein [Saprospiraceae bacterium]
MKTICTLLLATLFLLLTSCLPNHYYKKLRLDDIEMGMSKEEVQFILKKIPDNIVGAKQYKNGTIEVLQFTKHPYLGDSTYESYYLFFFNDKLVQWEKPCKWKYEADRIYATRFD